MKKESRKVKVYISYSRHDTVYKEQLVEHLEQLKMKMPYLDIYHDGKLLPGSDWDKELRAHLATSQVVLFLLSPDFVTSKYANEVETRMALDMKRRGQIVVVPVLLWPTDFTSLAFNRFQAVPQKDVPVATATDPEKAWKQVIRELSPLFEEIHDGSIEMKERTVDESPRNAEPFSEQIAEAHHQLEQGDIDNAMTTLLQVSKEVDLDLYQRAIWISSRYHSLDKDVQQGIFSPSEIPAQRSRFIALLMNLIRDLKTPDRYGQAVGV